MLCVCCLLFTVDLGGSLVPKQHLNDLIISVSADGFVLLHPDLTWGC